MNSNHTFEIDNSPAAQYVKGWMKKDNPHLDVFQLEQKWRDHQLRIKNISEKKAINRVGSLGA